MIDFLSLHAVQCFGTTAFSWMSEPGPVYVRKHVRDKHDPIVDKVDLLHANQIHAVVRYSEGREVTVLARYVAPTSTTPSNEDSGEPSPLSVQVQPELGPETCIEPETELNCRLRKIGVQLVKENLLIGFLIMIEF